MFGRLDRYIALTVSGSYLAGLVFMVLLFTLVSLLTDLGTFMSVAGERGIGLAQLAGEVLRYHALGIPVVFVSVAPFVSVIAGMFAISRHMSANEIVPMLFTGRSIVRVLQPVFVAGTISALAMAATWEFVIPLVAEPLHAAHRTLTRRHGDPDDAQSNLLVRSSEGSDRTLIVREYDHGGTAMAGVVLLDQGSGPDDLVLTTAESAVWDGSRGDWRLDGGRRHVGSRDSPQDWLGLPDIEPDLLWRLGKEGRETQQLSYSELLDLRELRPRRRDLTLAFHAHITFPLANLVLLLLALPFAVHFERGSRIERVVFAVMLCGVYLIADLTCQNLGRSVLHPILAAWLPTILFGSVGIAFFTGIRT